MLYLHLFYFPHFSEYHLSTLLYQNRHLKRRLYPIKYYQIYLQKQYINNEFLPFLKNLINYMPLQNIYQVGK